MKFEGTFSLLKTISDYFYSIFIGNLMFLISNMPLLYLLFFVLPPRSITPSTLELYLCLLPVGPAFTALLYAMGRLVNDGDIGTIRHYWKSYKLNFRQAVAVGSIISFFIVLLVINITSTYGSFFYLQIIALIVMIFEALYVFAILSRFQTTVKKALLMGFYSIFSHMKETMLMLVMMVFAFAIMMLYPSVGILFAISILAILIMIVLKEYLRILEEKN